MSAVSEELIEQLVDCLRQLDAAGASVPAALIESAIRQLTELAPPSDNRSELD